VSSRSSPPSNRVRSAGDSSRKPTSAIRSSASRRWARTHRSWRCTARSPTTSGCRWKSAIAGCTPISEDNKRLVRIGTRTADQYASDDDTSTSTTNLTGSSDAEYEHTGLTVDWLVTRYNLALAQAVLYDATEMRIRVWDHFGTVFSYVKLFGLMHRIYIRSTATVNASRTRTKPPATRPYWTARHRYSQSRRSTGFAWRTSCRHCPSVTAGRWLVRSSSTRRPARPDSSRARPHGGSRFTLQRGRPVR